MHQYLVWASFDEGGEDYCSCADMTEVNLACQDFLIHDSKAEISIYYKIGNATGTISVNLNVDGDFDDTKDEQEQPKTDGSGSAHLL